MQQNYVTLKNLAYICNVDLRKDLQDMLENYPEYAGSEIYIENSRNEYKERNMWEQCDVADAYLTGDFAVKDGGVPLFVEDEDAILIISKDLFQEYSNILAGRVILCDGNSYLIFNNHFYGE